jgi:hypothetical protein
MIEYLEDVMGSEPLTESLAGYADGGMVEPRVIKLHPYHNLAHIVALAESFGGDRPTRGPTRQISCAWNDIPGKTIRGRLILQEKKNKKAKRNARKKKRGY